MLRIVSAVVLCLISVSLTRAADMAKPNVVLILADDLGFGDLGVQGAVDFKTPHIDQLAREGRRFTNFYVAQPVCTASRAALMTGCYANRVGLSGALNHTSNIGINADEFLLPELFRNQGYATSILGKWHLGHRNQFLPTRNGFHEFFGIPYSNDNGPLHPVIRGIPPLPLYENESVIEQDPDQSQFTRRITERAVKFIEQHRDGPFFLYVPHIMPHVPIFASPQFRGRTKRGLYGDVVEELDWSVGEILATLKRLSLDENTLVIFSSDNGPFLSYGDHAGSAKPFREGKLTTFEGGVRVPFIARWVGNIPADTVCNEMATMLDILPTCARLLEATLPRPVDGREIVPLLHGEPEAKSPHDAFFYYSGDELHAVRSGRWKLHFPHDYLTTAGEPGKGGKPSNFGKLQPVAIEQSGIRGIASRHGYRVEKIGLSLFDLTSDQGETTDVSAAHPEIVTKLTTLAEQARADLGDSLTGRRGAGLRPVGQEKAQ